jgi:riboflavin kinase / FMN adenylyltransferase
MQYNSLFSFAKAVLESSCPKEKASLTCLAFNLWQEGELPFKTPQCHDPLPDHPARPEKPLLLEASQMPKRSTGERGRLTLLHALAHIELNAIDLAWDMIGRFGDHASVESQAFCTDWLRVAYEEQLHFMLLSARLKELGVEYGDFPAHDSLWEAAFDTKNNLEARLAVVPMVLEARGLDVTPLMIEQFTQAKDLISAEILQRIYRDEISHVEKGVYWFHHVVRLPPTQQQAQFHALLNQYFRGGLKQPFNIQARTQAGMPMGYYQEYVKPIRPARFMHIYRYAQDLSHKHQGAVWCLGNFDGVHLGHQALLKAAYKQSRQIKKPWGVVTFEPHPRTFFKPNDPPFRLSSFREKITLLKSQGVELILCAKFKKALADLTPEAFAKDLIAGHLKANHVFIGHDFYFGQGRLGTPPLLKALGEEYGFKVTILDPQSDESGTRFASQAIRKSLMAGQIEQAKAALGHPWTLEGRIQKGRQLARTLGFPTANIALNHQISPALGVYGVDIYEGENHYKGIANIGIRPSVDPLAEKYPMVLCEVHLFNFSGDLYGKRLRVQPSIFLRPEKKMSSLKELQLQIEKDIHSLFLIDG